MEHGKAFQVHEHVRVLCGGLGRWILGAYETQLEPDMFVCGVSEAMDGRQLYTRKLVRGGIGRADMLAYVAWPGRGRATCGFKIRTCVSEAMCVCVVGGCK